MRFMQTESVLQTKNRSEPAKNRFSVALIESVGFIPKIPRLPLAFVCEQTGLSLTLTKPQEVFLLLDSLVSLLNVIFTYSLAGPTRSVG